jgi:DMSO/TMAO reductase YedYZ molybdopterin-dependent catalytic subunit
MDPETLVVYEMNGEVLPREHGYPARLLVPGRYGMKNPKWLAGIRALNQSFTGWYDQRGWNPEGIVKTMSRIDVPTEGASLAPGEQPIAGIAYAGNRGIQKVEVSDDGGTTWREARILEPPAGSDTMVRWQASFSLDAGATATLVVRATDGTGDTQAEMFVLPQPDGSSGWDSIDVHADA